MQPDNGPASATLFTLTEDKPPTLDQWWAIWEGLDLKIGVAASNSLLLRVTVEALLAHPRKMAVLYGHNLAVATFRVSSPYVWQHPPVTIDDERLYSEFKRSGDQTAVTPLAKVVNLLFRGALVISTILVLLTIGPHGPAWTLASCSMPHNLLSIAVSGAPEGASFSTPCPCSWRRGSRHGDSRTCCDCCGHWAVRAQIGRRNAPLDAGRAFREGIVARENEA